MSDDIQKQPWDKRTGEQFQKDQQAVSEVTDKILKPEFKQEVPDELTKLFQWRNDVRKRIYAQLEPIIAAAGMRAGNDPLNAHSPSGRGALITTAHKLYLDELRKLSKDEAIFMLAFAYADRTIEDFL